VLVQLLLRAKCGHCVKAVEAVGNSLMTLALFPCSLLLTEGPKYCSYSADTSWPFLWWCNTELFYNRHVSSVPWWPCPWVSGAAVAGNVVTACMSMRLRCSRPRAGIGSCDVLSLAALQKRFLFVSSSSCFFLLPVPRLCSVLFKQNGFMGCLYTFA